MILARLVPLTELPSARAALARVRAEVPHHAFPDLDPKAHDRVSTVVAAIAPRLAPPRLALLVRYALWSLGLDDRIDTRPTSPDTPDDLDQFAESVAAAAAGRPATDPLLADLTDLLAGLSRYDSTGAARARCEESLLDAVTSGIEHRRLGQAVSAGTCSPPTTQEYLSVAARTVNYLSFAYALLALGDARLTESELDQLGPALRHGAYAVRLGNDLRSLTRDRAAGGLNVLGLPMPGAPVTARWVRQEITRRARAHDHALARRCGQPPVTRALTRSLRVSLALYQLADLR